MTDRVRLELHIPEPSARPKSPTDFASVQIPAAGDVRRPEVASADADMRDLPFGLIRVLDDAGAAVGPWNPGLPADTLRLGLARSRPRTAARFLFDGEPVSLDAIRPPATAQFALREAAGELLVSEGGQTWKVEPFRTTGLPAGIAADGAILSPMPGRVIAVDVALGERVAKGQGLLTLEAMKWSTASLPFDGVITEVNGKTGGHVSEGQTLIIVAAEAIDSAELVQSTNE